MGQRGAKPGDRGVTLSGTGGPQAGWCLEQPRQLGPSTAQRRTDPLPSPPFQGCPSAWDTWTCTEGSWTESSPGCSGILWKHRDVYLIIVHWLFFLLVVSLVSLSPLDPALSPEDQHVISLPFSLLFSPFFFSLYPYFFPLFPFSSPFTIFLFSLFFLPLFPLFFPLSHSFFCFLFPYSFPVSPLHCLFPLPLLPLSLSLPLPSHPPPLV